MPLGTEAGLGPGNIVLDEDPARSNGKGAQQPPISRPMSIVTMDQDATWYGSSSRHRPHYVTVR